MAIGKVEPSVDDLHYQHPSGIYRGRYRHIAYYYFQSPSRDPPYFPPPCLRDKWSEVEKLDNKMLDSYLELLHKAESLQRNTKKRGLDNVDIITKLSEAESCTESIAKRHAIAILKANAFTYWTSPEAITLFSPLENEPVHGCLRRRISMLTEASTNDDQLVLLIPDVEDISSLTTKQKEQL